MALTGRTRPFSSGLLARKRSSAVIVPSNPGAPPLAAITPSPSAIPAGGPKFARLAKTSAANYATGWFGPQEFNVLDYVNSGLSNDAAFAAAIADLNAAGGGTLRIPYNPAGGLNGVWFLSVALLPITVPCAIIGDGFGVNGVGGTCIIQSAATASVLRINTPSPCVISNIAFNGGATHPTVSLTGATPGTDFNSSSVIRECSFVGGDMGLYADAAFIIIRDCTATGTTHGIHCTNSVNLDEDFGMVTGCALGAGATGAGLWSNAGGMKVNDCDFNSGAFGFLFKCTAGITSADIWFSDNHAEGIAGPGLCLDGSAGGGCLLTRVVVVGNEFARVNGFGGTYNPIETNAPAAGAQFLVNLTVVGNSFNSYSTGVNLFHCDCVTVGDNVFDAGGGSVGINVDATAGSNGALFGNVGRGGTTLIVNTGGYATPSVSSGANPAAAVGLAAVNGVASTFMRSDAAPPIDQSIAPTWTALHTFNVGLVTVPFTVATLPAGVAGKRAFVSDALAPAFGVAVAGGGAVGVPVYHDGASWKVG